MEKNVTITMRPDQAARLAKWLGEMYVAELPLDSCQAIHAISVALKRGQSADVTAIGDRMVGNDDEARHLAVERKS